MFKIKSLTTSAVILAMLPQGVSAQRLAKPSGTQKLQQATMNDVPKCARKHGTISIVDGDDPRGWTQYSLAAPSKLLKVMVQRSGCFNLVDRGSGLQAAQLERDIGGNLGLQRRSNVGQGQIKAADYVLQAEVQAANGNASGSGIGAGIGGVLGGPIGGILGGIRSKKMEANVVLSITNVRTTETLATEDGYAAKNSLSFGGGGGMFGGGVAGGVVGGGYDNTDIGRIVTLAFIQSYAKLVNSLGYVNPGDTGTAEAAPAKTFTAQGPVAMRTAAATTGKVMRTLPAGSILYPTGQKAGLWWEVADENDNVGWVLNTKLAPSQ
ncbi:curli production assembly/transport component csgg [Sphingomonas sp. Leaf357]|uniref:CsgG/HfaB family protein n=1 Tax=Sphingomonas sp. Leaf357 TaxID=1736350 RepID=UPI0006F36126|nr:CsgG/HfaB family protein [Sphingomonas sp. Leaf357]KQS04370.1 curli production assembly/transport component csgg [Sphingomonas sp. Leaf357]